MIEQLVLASILIEPKHIKKCILDIEPTDFSDFKNKEIYKSMLRLYNKVIAIDYRTLLADLEKHKSGVGIDYLLELVDMLPTAEGIDSYIEIMREDSNRRKIITGFENVIKDKTVTSQDARNYVTNIFDNLNHINNDPIEMIHDDIDNYVNSIADDDFKDSSHKTLYRKLDERVLIQDGDYILVAGFTGTGKSALVMNFAKHFSMQKKKGLVVSLEMTKTQWLNRMIANVSGVENKKIQRKQGFSKDELLNITRSASQIKKLDIMINDKGGMKVEHIVNLCNKLKQKGKLDYLIVDNIGLVGTTKRCNGKTEEISHISNTLKQLALGLKIPVIVLSQFNRNATDSYTGKRREPVKEDLKHSGSLETDANVIIFLYSTHENIEEFVDRFMILKIAKNRDGECGKIPVVFKADKQMFREVDYDRDTQKSTEIALSPIGG